MLQQKVRVCLFIHQAGGRAVSDFIGVGIRVGLLLDRGRLGWHTALLLMAFWRRKELTTMMDGWDGGDFGESAGRRVRHEVVDACQHFEAGAASGR